MLDKQFPIFVRDFCGMLHSDLRQPLDKICLTGICRDVALYLCVECELNTFSPFKHLMFSIGFNVSWNLIMGDACGG